MAVATTNTPITSNVWTLAGSGAGTYHVSLGADGEYALAASLPVASFVGHPFKKGERLTLAPGASVNIYVRAPGPELLQGGSALLVVTPGQ